ncbi:hypothetical protein [Bradyrhizobium sp. OHSU_III]|jgi:Na+-transporting methylmalonyl-CoA/oxaloacetate decarboxylase gamma subunit|uniref:hypothetical protein n=1 Tax=Bradyrhizobium sp. OHSU_III TaxID=1297865 RepID=UPI00126916C7|nr:hypothetical protein [Bradyrhizobium sp. OHSU_III]
MMNGMTTAMTLGMGAVCALILFVLILAAVALVKYLRSGIAPPPERRDREDRSGRGGSTPQTPSR